MKTTVEHSVESISKEVSVDLKKYGQPAGQDPVRKTVEALKQNNIAAIVVNDSTEALDVLKKLIPNGAEVNNGSSTTLAEIGFVQYLQQPSLPWKNMHTQIIAEKDRAKQYDLRRKASTAEYFVSSAQAITQHGEIVGCDASGSRVGAWLFTAKNLIIVAGSNKIVPDMESAMKRMYDYAFKLENVRAKKVYGMGSNISKIAILAKEFGPRTTVILVNEALGY